MPHRVIMDIIGFELSTEEETILRHPEVAGVLLFLRNMRDQAQLIHLTQTIHAIRPDVIIMTDQEGGHVQRVQRMGTHSLMSARWHGKIFDKNPQIGLEIAREAGQIMAEDLLALGIDLSLAPVLDLHHDASLIIGQLDRAFHADPDCLIQLTTAYIQGMHAAGMPSVGKHFPGHGSCVGDSHLALPTNNKTIETLRSSDLKPFIELIKNHKLNGVMPAHVMYPAVDKEHAAGYSPHWLQGILREELSFEGLVISDCLGMKGADIGSLKTRAHAALDAGCDLLIVANQTRTDLAQLLNHLPHDPNPQSAVYLERFKQSIKRFQTPTQPKPEKITSFFNPSSSQDTRKETVFDAKNPTQGV